MSRKLRPCFKSVKSLESIYVHLRFPKMRKYYPAKFEPLRFANFSLNKKSLGLLFVCLFFFQQFTPDLIVRATWLPQNDHNTKDLWMCVFSFSFSAIEIMVTQFIIKHRMSVSLAPDRACCEPIYLSLLIVKLITSWGEQKKTLTLPCSLFTIQETWHIPRQQWQTLLF